MSTQDWAQLNRGTRKWSRREQIGRVLWGVAWPAFRLSPRPFWGWRRALLRLFGATVGAEAHVWPTARIIVPWNLQLGTRCAIGDGAILYALGPIRIGNRTSISQGAHLCAGTHDIDSPGFPLLKPPISIGDDTWICADAFVGPGVTIGAGSVVGARAVVVKDVPNRVVVAGNPARILRERPVE